MNDKEYQEKYDKNILIKTLNPKQELWCYTCKHRYRLIYGIIIKRNQFCSEVRCNVSGFLHYGDDSIEVIREGYKDEYKVCPFWDEC